VILKYHRVECDTMRQNAKETKIENGLLTLNGQSEPEHWGWFVRNPRPNSPLRHQLKKRRKIIITTEITYKSIVC